MRMLSLLHEVSKHYVIVKYIYLPFCTYVLEGNFLHCSIMFIICNVIVMVQRLVVHLILQVGGVRCIITFIVAL